MITWPESLQQLLNEAGFAQSFGETVIRTDMDIGPAKTRRRFTRGIDTFTSTIDLERDLYQTFRDFYDTTLNGGTLYFEFEHPITGDLEEFRFTAPPTISPLGGRYFRINMSWEIKI